MEAWRATWRNGVAPCLTLEQLIALHDALASDDVRLIQGRTSYPPTIEPPFANDANGQPIEAACVLGYCAAISLGGFSDSGANTSAAKVLDVGHAFSQLCWRIDEEMLKDTAGCRWFLNWFDETPREQMRRVLLPEVQQVIDARKVEGN